MPLSQIDIDDHTWDRVSDERRREWQATIAAVLDPAHLVCRPDVERIYVKLDEEGFQIEVFDEEDAPLEKMFIDRAALATSVQEYVDVMRQIADTQQSGLVHRVDALDMAKKVTHDRAARIVKRQLAPLKLDLVTARKVFTLLFSLLVDTTRLVGVFGHRRVR